MGSADSDIYQGSIRCPCVGTGLLGGSAISNDVRVRDMGPDAAHEEGVGRIPPQGVPKPDRAETAEGTGQRLGLPPAGGCDGGGRFAGGGDSRLQPP